MIQHAGPKPFGPLERFTDKTPKQNTMEKERFIQEVTDLVNEYIGDFTCYGSDAQISVIPETRQPSLCSFADRTAAVEDSDEVVENAAIAEGAATEEYEDYQVTRNPDFYPVDSLFTVKEGQGTPDAAAIRRLADRYFTSN